MYSTFFEISSIEFTTISSSFSLLSYLNSTYFTLGLSYGLHNTDFYYGLELSSPFFSNNYYLELGLVLVCIPLIGFILLMVNIGTLIKSNYKLQYRQDTAKKISRPLTINFRIMYIWHGIHAGKCFLMDRNSHLGIGVLMLGPNLQVMQFLVGNVWVWGILSSTPNLTLGIFRMSRLGVAFVGDNRVFYEGRILREVNQYRVIGQGPTSQVELTLIYE